METVGVEPTSASLQARCSPVELHPRDSLRGWPNGRAPHEPSPYPVQHRLDQVVAGGQRCGDPVTAVANDVRVTEPCEANRRRLAALLEPTAIAFHRGPVDAAPAALADPDPIELDPDRRRAALVLAHGRPLVSTRVRTGRFERPQRVATALQAAELSRARRPREGWPAGLEPAPAGLTTPDASVYTTATTERGRQGSRVG